MGRSVGFEGIGAGPLVTFKSALVRGTDENKLVKMSSVDETVELCTDGDDIFGIVRVIDAQDKMAGVQINGLVADYPALHATIPAKGFAHVIAKTASQVQSKGATAGWKLRRVIKSDDTNHLCTFEL